MGLPMNLPTKIVALLAANQPSVLLRQSLPAGHSGLIQLPFRPSLRPKRLHTQNVSQVSSVPDWCGITLRIDHCHLIANSAEQLDSHFGLRSNVYQVA